MIHQVVSGPSQDQLFHLSTAARVFPYQIVNGGWLGRQDSNFRISESEFAIRTSL